MSTMSARSKGKAESAGRKKPSSGKRRGWSAGEIKWDMLSAAAGHEPLASIHAYAGVSAREAEEFLNALDQIHQSALAAERRRNRPR